MVHEVAFLHDLCNSRSDGEIIFYRIQIPDGKV